MRKHRFLFTRLVVVLSWMTGFLPGASSQDYVEPMSHSIQALYQTLQDEIPLADPQTLAALRLGLTWLEGLETFQNNLRQGRTDGLVDWLMLWNGISRDTGPATLITRSAQSLRSVIARHAPQPLRLREPLSALRQLAEELVLELQAWDRIERHRRRDGIIQVVDSQGRPIPGAEVTLHQIRPDFLFGCNLFVWNEDETESQLQYRQRFAALLNYATLGFYWWSYEPSPGQTREAHWRRAAEWCRQQNIQTKGHTLLWNYTEPRWLPDDPKLLYEAQMNRITREMTRFAGLIDKWDVVNEATAFDRTEFEKRAPKLTHLWKTTGRSELPRQAFLTARRANPQAVLVINDYELRSRPGNQSPDSGPKQEPPVFEDILDALVDDQGRPLYDAIGIQSHMHGGPWPTRRILEIVQRFAKYNVPLHFTETTIVSGPGKWEAWESTTLEGELFQADEVERFYRTVFSCPEVAALTWWDFSDHRAWQGAPSGLLRKDMSPKPAYQRLMELIQNRWRTVETHVTDAAGQACFRGYRGDYWIIVKAPSGRPVQQPFSLPDDTEPQILRIDLAI